MCWRPFRRTSFNSILTLVHPLVLQLREYPLKPVSFTLCHFYLRSISPLLFSSQLSSISAACFPVSIHCPADVRLCGVVSNRPRTMGCLRAIIKRSEYPLSARKSLLALANQNCFIHAYSRTTLFLFSCEFSHDSPLTFLATCSTAWVWTLLGKTTGDPVFVHTQSYFTLYTLPSAKCI